MNKLREEEALDGYYVIITSEYEESSDRIIEMYRGLWKIEESFRVTKSDLEARPVFVSREDHIQAHFLTCFVSLVIARILEMKLDHRYSITRILESLAKAECSHLKQNYYLFDYYDEVLKDIGEKLNIDFSKKMLSLGEIKKYLGMVKKSPVTRRFYDKINSLKASIYAGSRLFFCQFCCKSQDISWICYTSKLTLSNTNSVNVNSAPPRCDIP